MELLLERLREQQRRKEGERKEAEKAVAVIT